MVASQDTPRSGSGALASTVLQAVGIIVLALTPIGVLTVLATRIGRQEPIDTSTILALLGALVAGVTCGGLLLGMASLLRMLAGARATELRRARTTPDRSATFPGDPLAPHMDDETGPVSANQVLGLLRKQRDLTHLDPDQREAAQERLRTYLQREAAEAVIEAINRRQLGKARVILRATEARYGATPTVQRLTDKLSEATARREPLDFAHTKRIVEEAIATANWALAEQYVRALYFNHPESRRCRQLWDETRRARLRAHIESCANRHHWAEALAAAQEFLARFPDSTEARALRSQIRTLEVNAEIHERKQYESRFKELLSNQQYAAALRVAQVVVHRFPASPQAQALRDQIPALEKKLTG